MFFEKIHAAMHATSNARAMIVQYWIGIPNRVNSLAKNSTNSSISQSYITLLITEIPWHSSLKDEAASVGGLILLDQIIRSITVGKDECHVIHLLHRKIFYIYITVHLKDVHAGTRDGV